jgi:hypothetical protein
MTILQKVGVAEEEGILLFFGYRWDRYGNFLVQLKYQICVVLFALHFSRALQSLWYFAETHSHAENRDLDLVCIRKLHFKSQSQQTARNQFSQLKIQTLRTKTEFWSELLLGFVQFYYFTCCNLRMCLLREAV